MNNQYNALIDIVSAVLVCAIWLAVRRQKKRGDPLGGKILNCLMACCTLVFLCDIPGLLLDGTAGYTARVTLWIFDGFYWILQAVYCWLWLIFADYWAYGSPQRLRRLRLLFATPMVLEIAAIFATPLTGWVFVIGADNVYARGSHYILNMLPYFVYILGALAAVAIGAAQNTDPERKRRCLLLAVYMFLPICGVIFDIFVYGISWVWPMVALSLLMVYLNVQQQHIASEQLAAAKLESELSESRMAIMLSQIQPHFLYNALNTIKHFCAGSPQAQEIVTDFAKYLRGNMDSLTNRAPIPFPRELEHLRYYLKIETIRFPDVKVVYDIGATEFLLPSLTVQPLVENAVCHGVTCREDGGTICITSREEASCFTVTVADNGIGFDPDEVLHDGRSHIGITNVRSRLEAMCGGTLTVQSTVNVGTTVTITIPKEGALCR